MTVRLPKNNIIDLMSKIKNRYTKTGTGILTAKPGMDTWELSKKMKTWK